MADSIMGGLIINEVLVDPNGAVNFDTDGSGNANARDEFVELYNSSNVPIDISGVELWDAGSGNWFTFPANTILQPGGHAMVITAVQNGGSLPTGGPNDLFFDAARNAPLLNNGGDNIVVYDPGSNEYIQARFNGDPLDDPPNDYSGFPAGAQRSGNGEDFGFDQDGRSIQRVPDGSDNFVNSEAPTPGTTNVCFVRGTRLETDRGARPVETLRPGDLVLTQDRGLQPIRWAWHHTHRAGALIADPRLQAVQITKDALAPGIPRRTLQVSRQHRILISSKIVHRMFGTSEILVPAKDLLAIPGVQMAPVTGALSYHHVLLRHHEVLLAEGVPSESLFLGPVSSAEVSLTLRREICASAAEWHSRARPFQRGARVRNLVARHLKNDRPFTATASWDKTPRPA
ncbi:Hint domain-containing protein [Thalassococcus sp. S3]|uniref:Hint domain-containing protein n=1 Tax=Thalassococcus sp. S3 TaxID=2017482 RepID=UPI0010245EC1|nr:Hint domain-containing protein [Thalassococcus sp. S3]QBF31004.1 hypothetical protein CFI11_07195 [Thalassococcus sp. S3]